MNIKLPKGHKKNQTITALDIGSFQVKALQAVYENGSIKTLLPGCGKTILDAISVFPESPKRVNISVSGQAVIIRYIEMPKMSKEELASALQFEAEKHIPVGLNEVVLDFHILEEVKDNKLRLLLVACKKELINSRIELLKNLNIAINIIDIDSLALANSFLYSANHFSEDNIFALINIGAKFTNLHILSKDNSYLIRDISGAGDEITRIISEKLAIPAKEAEALKCDIPLGKEAQIAELVEPVIENIAQELQMSFDYLDNSYGKAVDKIFISGGSCNLKGIDGLIKERMNMDVTIWNPLEYEGFIGSPEFAIAAGLCLRR